MGRYLPVKQISHREICDIFNERQYYHKIQTGEIWEDLLDNPHATPKRSGQPHCTHSQLIAYRERNSNRKVALVHQYLRPDGRIGASGKPDPKWLLGDGEILVPDNFSNINKMH
jgi:hypothetical protein